VHLGWAGLCLLAACGRIGFDEAEPADPIVTPKIGQLTVGYQHACVRTIEGGVFCWGGNGFGQLGNGATDDSRRPTVTASGIVWADLSAGETHTCGLDSNGIAYCWGTGTNGQLGFGVVPIALVPMPIDGQRTYRRIFAGSRSTCAIATDRTLWCWGRNGARQLGIGGNTDVGVPTQVLMMLAGAPDDQWDLVGMGDDHTCAVQTDRSAWCWGSEVDGQLGVAGTVTTRDRPQPVTSDPAYTAIAAGQNYSLGVVGTGGAVASWGLNANGQLGLGDLVSRRAPGLMSEHAHDIVSAGVSHACARRTDASLVCWGKGNDGELGIGITDSFASTPVTIPGQWLSVGCGNDFTCALDADEAVWCWGSNSDGKLGNGGTSRSLVPVQVTGDPI